MRQPQFSFMASPSREAIADGAVLLRGFALAVVPELIAGIEHVARVAPFRHMITPGGHRMSVAMTNCGELGWITDERGYRYERIDPLSGRAWPAMPGAMTALASAAAKECGHAAFDPDACLVNRYEPSARMTLHQDRNERDGEHALLGLCRINLTFRVAG